MTAPGSTSPNVTERPDRICMQGDNLVQIAGLLAICAEKITRELISIHKRYPDALVGHSKDLADQSLLPLFFQMASA